MSVTTSAVVLTTGDGIESREARTWPLGDWTEPVAVGPTVRTPCPRSQNTRRKCSLCAADAALRHVQRVTVGQL